MASLNHAVRRPRCSPLRPKSTVPLPTGLPVPVERYFRTVLGDLVPVVETAVVSGRGRLRFAGLTLPARFRFTHEAGRSYRHDIECTWFGLPILTVVEIYLEGHAHLGLPFGVVENDPKTDQAANLNLWGEVVWFPSILATDPRVRWEPVDGTTARLVVPRRVRTPEAAGPLIAASRYRPDGVAPCCTC